MNELKNDLVDILAIAIIVILVVFSASQAALAIGGVVFAEQEHVQMCPPEIRQ